MNHTVFVNRILNMKKIKFIGLDMDHTLVRYQTKNFEETVYKLVVERLILDKGYPDKIKQCQFDFAHAIRGLVVDCQNGNILKLSRFAAIRHSSHGTKPIEFIEQQRIYRSIYIDLRDPNYIAIDTVFSIAFCVLYAQLIDYKDQHPQELPDYNTLAYDALHTVNAVHAQGSLKPTIIENLEQFVLRDENIVLGLKRMIKYGKKIFLLTNSEYYYTKHLLNYAITPYMQAHESWQDLFEFVIVAADKPRFFYDHLPFTNIKNLNQTIKFEKHGIYQGGNATEFTQALSLSGDEILYIGDHIYGDILRLKKACNWRTALVIEEIGHEIEAQHKARYIQQQINSYMEEKKELEHQYVTQQSIQIDNNRNQDHEITALHEKLMRLDQQISLLIYKQNE